MFVQKVTYHIFVVGHLNRVSTSVCLLTVLFILSQIVQMLIALCNLNFTVFVQPCERVNQIGIQQLSVMGLLKTICVMFEQLIFIVKHYFVSNSLML